jgi:transcriptional regulator with XRE-family HTH domain
MKSGRHHGQRHRCLIWASACVVVVALLGLTQQQLAGAVGVRFQQIQKYECGANRISAARLWQLSEALEVPVGYFYDGLSDRASRRKPAPRPRAARCSPARRRWTLVRAYYLLGERPRRRLLDLAKSLNGGEAIEAS